VYRENRAGLCPLNGDKFDQRTLAKPALPAGAVKALSELVEGRTYELHFCTDHGIRIALPPEKETWYHVVRSGMIFRGLDSAGNAVFDVEVARRRGWVHDLWELGLKSDGNTWEHYRFLMPASA